MLSADIITCKDFLSQQFCSMYIQTFVCKMKIFRAKLSLKATVLCNMGYPTAATAFSTWIKLCKNIEKLYRLTYPGVYSFL